MELSIQKWGNSAAVRLPSILLSQMGVAMGDKLSAEVRPEGLVLRAARRSYSLADLMAQCDLSAPAPCGTAGWDETEQAGKEVW